MRVISLAWTTGPVIPFAAVRSSVIADVIWTSNGFVLSRVSNPGRRSRVASATLNVRLTTPSSTEGRKERAMSKRKLLEWGGVAAGGGLGGVGVGAPAVWVAPRNEGP